MELYCPNCKQQLEYGKLNNTDKYGTIGFRYYCKNCGWHTINDTDHIVAFDYFGEPIYNGEIIAIPILPGGKYWHPEIAVGMILKDKIYFLNNDKIQFVHIESREALEKCKIVKVKLDENIEYELRRKISDALNITQQCK